MSQSLTRRGLVATTSAAVVAVSLPPVAVGAIPDAALLALRQPYERTFAAMSEIGAARRRAGRDIAETQWNAAVDANAAVIEQITEMPARTVEGLIFKARVAEIDSGNLDLAASIVADLVAMEGSNA